MPQTNYSSRIQNRQAGIDQSVVHNNEQVRNYLKNKRTSGDEIATGEPIPKKQKKIPICNSFDSFAAKRMYDHVVQLPNQQKDLQSEEYEENPQNLLLVINQRNRAEIFDLLEKGNVNINVQDKNGMTTLMFAVYGGHTAIVHRLLACENIDINVQDKKGMTALMLSIVSSGMTAVMNSIEDSKPKEVATQLLIAAGADIDIRDRNGNTVLMYALKKLKLEIVQDLLAVIQDLSAHFDVKNSEHIQALKYAFGASNNFKAMLPILAQLNSGFSKEEYKKDNTEYITLSYTLQDKTYKFSFIKDELINSIRKLLQYPRLQEGAKFAISKTGEMSKSNPDQSKLPNKFEYLKNGRACSEKNKIALQKLLEKVLK